MTTKWQRFKVDVPSDFTPAMRESVGLAVAERIRVRTLRGIDKNGDQFVGYSESYKNSLEFRVAGKSGNQVNLRLSGDMLAALDVISNRSGVVTVGYERGSEENGKADGNIRGTYGQSKPTGKARDFLGLPKEEIERIISLVRRENG